MNIHKLQDYGLWWAHLGSNQGPTGYEPVALPAELWALQMQAAQGHLFVLWERHLGFAAANTNRMNIQPKFVKQKAVQLVGLKSVIFHKAFQLSASAGMP